MRRTSLDTYDRMPDGMRSYLRNYGWHFNRKACEFAARHMYRRTESGSLERTTALTREQVDDLLSRTGVQIENDVGYDMVYVATMCRSDYLGSSISDEVHLAKIIRDILDDADAGDGEVMRCWYAKMVARGIPVDWEDLL
nr:MAG TPA: hypothetical protein [Caudoviricetes sp.]